MQNNSHKLNASTAKLQQIRLDQIERNPDNPRILFRQQEMNELLDSIRRWGIQVPITVFKRGSKFVLIDGERRWKCSLKLNKKLIPALIGEEPDRLTNMLLMFNIHGLREQWDLLTIALKLRDVIDLLTNKSNKKPTEKEISGETGLKPGVIRRARYLLNLPEKYHKIMLDELRKPKSKQVLTEDFFIEMERALTTVERAMPSVFSRRDHVRGVLIKKFRDNVIENRVHFRKVAQIARAKNVDSDPVAAERALQKLFSRNNYSIQEAYEDSVSEAYSDRDIATKLYGLVERLREIESDEIDEQVKEALNEIIREAQRLLRE